MKRKNRNPPSSVDQPDQTAQRKDRLANLALQPTVQAGVTANEYLGKSSGEQNLGNLITELKAQVRAVNQGDMCRSEALLTAQAHTLDLIYNTLARRAINANLMSHLDRYLRLALRAQSQCRATLETLATIKNPPPLAFVRQANIAHGPQQVNNEVSQTVASRARKNEKRPNELLEQQDGERLEFGTACASGGADSHLETVGAFDRTEDDSG